MLTTKLFSHDALTIVNHILYPDSLNHIQEKVFLASWDGKPYPEIAVETGYGLDYIKKIGSRLWDSFSEATGERVTKRNVHQILARLQTKTRLTSKLNDLDSIDCPGRAIPMGSRLYVERSPVEAWAYTEMLKPGGFVYIKAPQKMGKTSLIYRILLHTKTLGLNPAQLSFKTADISVFQNIKTFLQWFCTAVSHRVGLHANLNDYWNTCIGSKSSCTLYFQDYLLSKIDRPIVLALDDIDRMFDYPDLLHDVLSLLQSWHEEAAINPVWQKLRLVVAHSTEACVPLRLNQPLFNVGLPLDLPEFTLEQVSVLAQQYGLAETELKLNGLETLMSLVGGHPYLVQLALYTLSQRQHSIEALLHNAPTQAGIYKNHLRQRWDMLQQHPDLWMAFRHVLMKPEGVELDPILSYHLENMGLVQLTGNRVMLPCQLYRLYFSPNLSRDEAIAPPIDAPTLDVQTDVHYVNSLSA